MYGGNDGLNTVIPYTDKAYYAGRPELAYDESEVLPLADGLGFNASMTGLKKVYDAGQLAVVRGVGYPNADRSHFRSMSIWQTASPDTPPTDRLARSLARRERRRPAARRQRRAGAATAARRSALRRARRCRRPAESCCPTARMAAACAPSSRRRREHPLVQRVAQSGADLFRVAQTFGPDSLRRSEE